MLKHQWKKAAKFAVIRPGLFAIFLSVFGSLVVVVPFLVWPQTPAFLVISAEVETIKYIVARPDIAEIPLANVRIKGLSESCQFESKTVGESVVGILKPPKYALVFYRWSAKGIVVQVQRKADVAIRLELPNGQICEASDTVSVVIPNPSRTRSQVLYFPIAGPASAGVEMHVPLMPLPNRTRPSGMLYEAEIRIFGRTIFGALYPAQVRPVVLPAGGRLSSIGQDFYSKDGTEASGWYGIAIVGERAFNISTTTEATNLKFFRPSGSNNLPIDLNLFTGLLNDPSIAILSLGMLSFAILMQAVAGWVGIWKKEADRLVETEDTVSRSVKVIDRVESRSEKKGKTGIQDEQTIDTDTDKNSKITRS